MYSGKEVFPYRHKPRPSVSPQLQHTFVSTRPIGFHEATSPVTLPDSARIPLLRMSGSKKTRLPRQAHIPNVPEWRQQVPSRLDRRVSDSKAQAIHVRVSHHKRALERVYNLPGRQCGPSRTTMTGIRSRRNSSLGR